jgi:hypothetical protein
VIVMDLHTRQLLDEAIALDDKMRAECEWWEAKRAQARTQLVYKVHEPKVAAQQQRTTPMVDAVSAAWVQARLEDFAVVIGAEVGKTQTEIVKNYATRSQACVPRLQICANNRKRAEICPASYRCKGERREC